jgi:hypothetical protein
MKRADLKVPWVADEGELEQRLEDFPGQHFTGGDNSGVAREFAADAMAGQVADTAADNLGQIIGIPPATAIERRPDARPTGFSDMHEQKFMAQ